MLEQNVLGRFHRSDSFIDAAAEVEKSDKKDVRKKIGDNTVYGRVTK